MKTAGEERKAKVCTKGEKVAKWEAKDGKCSDEARDGRVALYWMQRVVRDRRWDLVIKLSARELGWVSE